MIECDLSAEALQVLDCPTFLLRVTLKTLQKLCGQDVHPKAQKIFSFLKECVAVFLGGFCTLINVHSFRMYIPTIPYSPAATNVLAVTVV